MRYQPLASDSETNGHLRGRIILTTPQGGRLAVDERLLALRQQAAGHSLEEILAAYANPSQANQASPGHVRAALACLAEAGLLERETSRPREKPTEDQVAPIEDLVSAVIVNYNSQEWLAECLPSLQSQTYRPIEVIVVDNGSFEDPTPWLSQFDPGIKVLRLERPVGLAAAINRGVALAQGQYYFILNPDVRLEPQAVAEMVVTARACASPSSDAAGGCAGVTAKLKYWWAPGFLNGLGNRVGFSSWGADNAQGHLDLGQFDHWHELPSLCFAAALIPRQAWKMVGKLDEGFPLYYEDVDWSYRARLLGHHLYLAPKAVIYHAMGRRIHTGEESDLSPAKLHNVTYGRLRFAYKIFSQSNLVRVLLTDGLEDLLRFSAFVVSRSWPKARAVLAGWKMFLRDLPQLRQARGEVQGQRAHPDQTIFALQRAVPPPLIWRGLPELSWDIVQHTYLPLMIARKTRPMPELETPPSQRPSLLIISQDIVGEKMAGPGMRYLEMARALSTDLDVTLAFPGEGSAANSSLLDQGVHLFPYRFEHPQDIETLVSNNNVVLFSSFILDKFPFLQKSQARRVVDLYDPQVLENLHHFKEQPLDVQEGLNQQAVASMNRLLQAGDYFICGNLRQRDLWLGALMANGRITPHSFAQDSSLNSLIDVVGVGFPSRAPLARPFLRGQHPAFTEQSRIVLWGGGIWDWLDPLSLIQAWPQVVQQHPQARLVLLGTRHPNPLVPPHKMAARAIALAKELGEKDRSIFFYEWLAYEDREALLCEADIGVTLHPLHAETRYSIRTRILDYFWAGLPTLVSDGDVTSEWVRQHQLGRVVPPKDVNAVAQALNELLSQPKSTWAPAFARLAEVFAWPQVAAPLRRYCLSGPSALSNRSPTGHSPLSTTRFPISTLLARARAIWRAEGTGVLLHRLWRYVQWRLSRL